MGRTYRHRIWYKIFLHIFRHKFICEISQNTMYQYILAVIWCFFVTGIVISILSSLHLISRYLHVIFSVFRLKGFKVTKVDNINSLLTLREIEYLECLKELDLSLYGEVLKEVIRTRPDLFSLKKYFDSKCDYLAKHVWIFLRFCSCTRIVLILVNTYSYLLVCKM